MKIINASDRFNIDDKVVCKKNFNQDGRVFIIDKIYKVLFMHNELIAISPITYSRSFNEKIGKNSEHFWFSINHDIENGYDFYEYFITLKESRKLKIKKIECQ